MRIKKIEFSNFRNFKEHGEITFSEDNNVTVIYGTNGDGKTTMHQMFQWVFYGETHFNKTASSKLYNLKLEEELPYSSVFSVWASVDFDHPNYLDEVEHFNIRREWKYKKEIHESRLISQECIMLKQVGDDWKKVADDPGREIERILPSGLSQYFFFDGESMIADLGTTGRDSAKSLRKAIYSIFDLDIYEQALIHIGTQRSGLSTVLGKLYNSKAEGATDSQLLVLQGQVNQKKKQIDSLKENLDKATDIVDSKRREIEELSEEIGNTKKKSELEIKRKRAKDNISNFENAIQKEMLSFGNDAYRYYPYLLMSYVVKEAQNRIGLKVGEEHLIPGLQKSLIDALLNEDECICGRPISEEHKNHLKEYLYMLPPLSYKSMYDNFTKQASRWSTSYDKYRLANHIETIFKYKDSIEKLHEEVREIDEDLKIAGSKDELISNRAKAEAAIDLLGERIKEYNKNLAINEQLLRQYMKKYDDLSQQCLGNKVILDRISVMESVKEYFENKINSVSIELSQKLGEAIQELVNKMLNCNRKVTMTPKFELSVMDEFGDESKSEGQFAVVSFAYIGGIFKVLSDEPALQGKEYPLILDGPFSKLDIMKRQSVIDTIPTYASQIILFSKDDINSCFKGQIDNIEESTWTLFSNNGKNITVIKKGYFPEVFS